MLCHENEGLDSVHIVESDKYPEFKKPTNAVGKLY